MIMICDYMKWDYHTYNSQPDWFVNSLIVKINLDNKHARNKTTNNHRC